MFGIVLSKASLMTQLSSSANVSAREFACKEDPSSIWFNSNNVYVVFSMLFVNFVNIKQV